MPFHEIKTETFCFCEKKILHSRSTPLQVPRPRYLTDQIKKYKRRERVFSITSHTGSVTLEAALVLPLVLWFLLAILQIYCLYTARIKVENAMMEMGRELGRNWYVRERSEELGKTWLNLLENEDRQELGQVLEGAVTDLYLTGRLQGKTGSALWSSQAVKGTMTMAGSVVNEEAQFMDLQTDYQWKISILPGLKQTFYQKQWQRHALWLGKSLSSHQVIVYITPNGTVYHMKQDCTYLTNRIQKVAASDIENRRNQKGAKYEACSLCRGGILSGIYVYITEEGTRFHMDMSCSALKRSVIAISKDKVAGLKRCSRCGL